MPQAGPSTEPDHRDRLSDPSPSDRSLNESCRVRPWLQQLALCRAVRRSVRADFWARCVGPRNVRAAPSVRQRTPSRRASVRWGTHEPEIAARASEADVVLVSVPPGQAGDPGAGGVWRNASERLRARDLSLHRRGLWRSSGRVDRRGDRGGVRQRAGKGAARRGGRLADDRRPQARDLSAGRDLWAANAMRWRGLPKAPPDASSSRARSSTASMSTISRAPSWPRWRAGRPASSTSATTSRPHPRTSLPMRQTFSAWCTPPEEDYATAEMTAMAQELLRDQQSNSQHPRQTRSRSRTRVSNLSRGARPPVARW